MHLKGSRRAATAVSEVSTHVVKTAIGARDRARTRDLPGDVWISQCPDGAVAAAAVELVLRCVRPVEICDRCGSIHTVSSVSLTTALTRPELHGKRSLPAGSIVARSPKQIRGWTPAGRVGADRQQREHSP
jgi:hypothetical protein